MTNLLDSQPTGPAVPLPPPGTPAAPRRPAGPPKRTPMGVRFLWKLFAAILVIGALVWGPYQVVVLLAHEERVENQTFPAAGLTKLDIDGNSGTVRIETADTDTVQVRAEISDGLRRTGESRQVVGDTLRLHSTCPNFGSDWCRVNYTVTMPAALALVVHNDNGRTVIDGATGPVNVNGDNGSIELNDVSGTVDVSTDNGSVEASGLRSSQVAADSDNGHVTLEFSQAPTDVRATSDNGRVEVVVPADGTAYAVDATSDNGSRTVTVPLSSSSAHRITARSDNGSVTVRTPGG
jgi:hypothetical protein